MKKQYAVFVLGKFGSSVAVTLEKLGCEVIAIDIAEEKVQEIADQVSYAMRADLHDTGVIQSLGLRNLDGAVVAIADNMESSIMATILSKEAGIPYVLAKAQDELHASILKRVGADAIVFPEMEMGRRVAKNLVSTNFADWIELSPDYSIVETRVPEKWIGKTLRELRIRERYGFNVVGIKKDEKVDVNVRPEMPLEEGTIMIFIGSNEMLNKYKGE